MASPGCVERFALTPLRGSSGARSPPPRLTTVAFPPCRTLDAPRHPSCEAHRQLTAGGICMRLNLVPFVALALTVTAACGSSTDTSTSSSSSGGVDPHDLSDTAIAAVFLGSCVPDDGISRTLNSLYTYRTNEPWYELFAQHTACLAGKTNGCEALKD